MLHALLQIDSSVLNTVRFETFWLVFWILVTVVLLALAFMGKLPFPQPISLPYGAIIGAILIFVAFVLFLAGMADDAWLFPNPRPPAHATFGLLQPHDDNNMDGKQNQNTQSLYYTALFPCTDSSLDSDSQNWCRTWQAAGITVLIFGILGVVVSLIATISLGLGAIGKSAGPLGNMDGALIQATFILALACIMIFAVSFFDTYRLVTCFGGPNNCVQLGDSWALVFVTMVLALILCFCNLGGGAGHAKSSGVGQQQQNTAVVPPA